jgi:hypothetical protein
MRRKLLAAPVAVAIVSAAALWAPWTSNATASPPSGYEPHLNPKDFSLNIDNPYFPLPVGRVWIYKGTKDGVSQVDRVEVTTYTKKVAEGITARVVTDVAKHGSTLLESTDDYYAQDKKGNVWYLGEYTTAYHNGHQDHSGSWEAGVGDGEPGIVMLADPQIPDSYRQEYLFGKAEDTAWIVDRGGSFSVPFGTFHHVLNTLEFARIEPDVVDRKIYAPGVGIIYEEAITGEKEVARLVKMSG